MPKPRERALRRLHKLRNAFADLAADLRHWSVNLEQHCLDAELVHERLADVLEELPEDFRPMPRSMVGVKLWPQRGLYGKYAGPFRVLEVFSVGKQRRCEVETADGKVIGNVLLSQLRKRRPDEAAVQP